MADYRGAWHYFCRACAIILGASVVEAHGRAMALANHLQDDPTHDPD